MKRADLDHILRAAGEATGQRTFVLVGSATIFAWQQIVPPMMNLSREADIFADGVSDQEAERIADELEDLGQLSPFDDQFGYYVDGVSPATAILPRDWRDRSKSYSTPATNGVTAIVPHPEDISLAKLCVGREKDMDWVVAANRAGFIDLEAISRRIPMLPERTAQQTVRIRELIDLVRRRSR